MRLTSHEAVCAERYSTISKGIASTQENIERLFTIVLWAASALILGMAGVITTIAVGHIA